MELRAKRESAGKKIEEAAKELDCSTAKISRLETGKGVPFPRDVRDLLTFYGVGQRSEKDSLLHLAADGRAQNWYDSYTDVVKNPSFADHLDVDGVGRFVALEQDAAIIRTFEVELVPGLLQTEEYVNEMCSINFPDCTPKERARFVEFRLNRQDVLLREGRPLGLDVVIDELVILREVGTQAIMRRQLGALLENRAAADIRLKPLAKVANGSTGGPFSILLYDDDQDQNITYIEGREGAQYLESDEDVDRYKQIFADLQRISFTSTESSQRLERRIAELT